MKGEESKVSISPSACPRSYSVRQISDPVSDAFFASSSPVSAFTIPHDYGLIHIKVEIIQNRDTGLNADTFRQVLLFHVYTLESGTTETPEEGTLRESW